jgi:hypothetical protein
MRQRLVALAATVVLVPAAAVIAPNAVAAPAASSAVAAERGTGCDKSLYAKPVRANKARKSDAKAFATAAKRNGRGVASLTREAKADRSLWLDRCGAMFFVEATTASAPTVDEAVTAPRPLAETFELQSRPGSARTIYLDFTGDTITNTAWNASYGATILADPFSITAPADTNFTDAELTQIQLAWQAVAEDYAPFNVNVTTKDLGTAAIDRTSSSDLVYGTRNIVTASATTPSGSIQGSCGCGGVAYVNVFNTTGSNHLYYQPAWVFTHGVGTNGKTMAEAISHEVGHNFGLSHDGTATVGYYSGSAPWAPIMGVGYNQPITQWSKGEYPGANQTQDDLAIIATGAPLMTDDIGNTPAAAMALGNGDRRNGLISSRSDVDVFTFAASGSTTLSVDPAPGSPDLDVELTIRDQQGAVVAVVNPTSARVSTFVASGLGAAYTGTLPAGTYTATVDGIGTGDPSTAGRYNDYASLGYYQVSLTTQDTAIPLSSTASTPPPATVGQPYSASPVGATGGSTPYAWTAVGLPDGLSIDAGTGAVSGTPGSAGSFAATITVTDSLGASSAQGVTFSVNSAPTPATVVNNQAFSAPLGSPFSAQAQASGGDGTYTWTRTGTLPPGLTFSASGLLSGTPTTAGTYSFTATAASAGTSDPGTITVTVASAFGFTTGATLPNATLNTSYSTTLAVSGGSPTYAWSIAGGALPSGLTFKPSAKGSRSTATITGRPKTRGTFSVTVAVTDSTGARITRTFSITVT